MVNIYWARKDKVLAGFFLLLILISFLTNFYGSTDVGDYSDVAKFFAGKYSADIRNSHSYFYGFIHAPIVKLTNSFVIFKITSLISILLIITSVYLISGKDRRALWLIILSPVVGYMIPWISPIPLASLCLLWSYYFIRKYDSSNAFKYLFYSSFLIGLGWVIWDTIFFFGAIMLICFLCNKKFYSAVLSALFLLIGLIPRLVLDQKLFGFAFYTTLKTFFASLVSMVLGGIYGAQTAQRYGLISFIAILIALPLYYFMVYKKSEFLKNKKEIIFITLSLLLIFSNPQIRYLLALIPIMVLASLPYLDKRKFKFQIKLSVIVLIIFFIPYTLQIFYSISANPYGDEITTMMSKFGTLSLQKDVQSEIASDLSDIGKSYGGQIFLVGNTPDDYQILAHVYWGADKIQFVSIQDYNLWKENRTILFEKTFMPTPRIADRRQIWVTGGIMRNLNDNTNYSAIRYGLGINEPLDSEDFKLIKKYDILYLSERK